MKSLIQLFLILMTFFVSLFLVINITGVITIDDIKGWLMLAEEISPLYIVLVVALLLFIDLFISIPTLIVCMLAGYFLGFGAGAVAAMIGLTAAGVTGYTLSRLYGVSLLKKVIKCEEKIADMERLFHRHGFIMILLSRAIPMVPESAACMSGITQMPLKRFMLAWMLASYPYALVAAYAGSVSTIDDPAPAIFTAIGMMLLLWLGVTLFSRYRIAQQ